MSKSSLKKSSNPIFAKRSATKLASLKMCLKLITSKDALRIRIFVIIDLILLRDRVITIKVLIQLIKILESPFTWIWVRPALVMALVVWHFFFFFFLVVQLFYWRIGFATLLYLWVNYFWISTGPLSFAFFEYACLLWWAASPPWCLLWCGLGITSSWVVYDIIWATSYKAHV